MTTTRRRTARITTDAKPAAKKPKPVYEGVVIARVFSRQTGALLGYLAKPSKPLDEKGRVLPWYRVTRDAHDVLHCNCDAHGDCKHKTAVLEIEAIHKAEERAAAQPDAPAAVQSTPTTPAASEEQPAAPAAQVEEKPLPAARPANVIVLTDSRRQTARPVIPARRDDPPKGSLHSSQHRGGFADACFGSLQGNVRAATAVK